MTATAWPVTAELAKRLNVESGDWDTQLDRVMAAAIAETKQRVGDWDEDFDQPNEAISQSALELAVELATTGEMPKPGASKSDALLYGQRRRFSIG